MGREKLDQLAPNLPILNWKLSRGNRFNYEQMLFEITDTEAQERIHANYEQQSVKDPFSSYAFA